MNKIFIFLFIFFLALYSCRTKQIDNNIYREQLPSEGCIPTKEAAIQIAGIIWQPIFGDNMNTRKPFIATLINDSIWMVTGSPPPLGSKGGCGPYMEISKKTARVYKIDEYK